METSMPIALSKHELRAILIALGNFSPVQATAKERRDFYGDADTCTASVRAETKIRAQLKRYYCD